MLSGSPSAAPSLALSSFPAAAWEMSRIFRQQVTLPLALALGEGQGYFRRRRPRWQLPSIEAIDRDARRRRSRRSCVGTRTAKFGPSSAAMRAKTMVLPWTLPTPTAAQLPSHSDSLLQTLAKSPFREHWWPGRRQRPPFSASLSPCDLDTKSRLNFSPLENWEKAKLKSKQGAFLHLLQIMDTVRTY